GGAVVERAEDDAAGPRVAAHPGLVRADRREAAEVRGRAGRDVVPREGLVVRGRLAVLRLRWLGRFGRKRHARDDERTDQGRHEQHRSPSHRGKYYRFARGSNINTPTEAAEAPVRRPRGHGPAPRA